MFFNESVQDVLKKLESDEHNGLSKKKVQENLAKSVFEWHLCRHSQKRNVLRKSHLVALQQEFQKRYHCF